MRQLGAVYGVPRGGFTPNINAMIQTIPGVTLESFQALTKAQFSATGAVLVEEHPATIDGQAAWVVSYDFNGGALRLRAPQ